MPPPLPDAALTPVGRHFRRRQARRRVDRRLAPAEGIPGSLGADTAPQCSLIKDRTSQSSIRIPLHNSNGITLCNDIAGYLCGCSTSAGAGVAAALALVARSM